MSALRELLATFGIEVDTKELHEADGKVEGFIGKLKEVGKQIGEAFALHEIKEFIQGQVEAAESLQATATRIGTTTDELQALQLAAKESSVSAETMTHSLMLLNRNMAQAKTGTGDAAEIFQRLHISFRETDGSARPAVDVLGDVADKIAAIQDPAQKTEIATKLLGRGAAELIPLLNKGSAAFADARQQVIALGGGIDRGFIEQAEEASKAEAQLDFSLQSLKTQIVRAVLPAVTQFVVDLRDLTVGVVEFVRMHPAVQKILLLFGGVLGVAALAFVGQMAISLGVLAVETIAATWPFLALALALEEIVALVTGHRSILGLLFGGGGEEGGGEEGPAVEKLKETQSLLAALKGGAGGTKDALAGAFHATTGAVKGTNDELRKTKGLLADAKDNWSGMRGEPGFKPHAAIPLNWLKGGREMMKGAQFLTPKEMAMYGDTAADPELAKKASDMYGFGLGKRPVQQNTYVPSATPTAFYVPQTPAGPSLNAQLAAAGITIQQKIDTHIEMHGAGTASDKERKEVGQAIGAGVANAHQRANDKAKIALRRP